MKEFFGYDGWFLRILTKMGELIILNLIFLVCCIPIVTIGPSIISLYYATVKSVRRDYGNPVKEFFSSMKRVMKKGILYTIALVGWTGAFVYLRDLSVTLGGALKPILYLCDLVLILTAAFGTYIFPVLSRFAVGVRKTCSMAFMMSIRFFYFTLPIVGLTGGLIFLVAAGIIPAPTIFIVPAFWCFAVSFPMEQVLLAYMPKPEEGEEAWYYPTKDPEKEAEKEAKRAARLEEREKARHMREARRSAEAQQRNARREERGKQ